MQILVVKRETTGEECSVNIAGDATIAITSAPVDLCVGDGGDSYRDEAAYVEEALMSLSKASAVALAALLSDPASLRRNTLSDRVDTFGTRAITVKGRLERAIQSPDSLIMYLPVKGVARVRLTVMLRPTYTTGRLLVLSPFQTEQRITRKSVMPRDTWIRTLIDRYLFCNGESTRSRSVV